MAKDVLDDLIGKTSILPYSWISNMTRPSQLNALTGNFRKRGPGSGAGLPCLSLPSSAETVVTRRAPAAASLLLVDDVIALLWLASESGKHRGESIEQLKEVTAEWVCHWATVTEASQCNQQKEYEADSKMLLMDEVMKIPKAIGKERTKT